MNLPATIQGLHNLTASDAMAKAEKILPRVAALVLVILIAWEAARFTWLFLPRRVETMPAATAASSATATTAQPGRRFSAQRIADAHLFGTPNATDAGDIANAPTTQMTLVLAGVIATGDATKGFAFIGESANAAKFLRVGDSVAGAARLHSVYPDRVMLDRGGRVEALWLPRSSGGSMIGARPAPLAMNPPPAAPARFVENIKRIAETNPAAFSEIVRPQIAQDKGVMQGFRVYPGRNRQQFAKLGLQPGDLVKAINGTPLDDPQRSTEIFNTLSTSDRALITIERNGQIQQLTLNTAQIALPDPTEPQHDAAPHDPGMPPQDQRPSDPTRAPARDTTLVDPRGAEIQ
jgi:general secretion pathway protein C